MKGSVGVSLDPLSLSCLWKLQVATMYNEQSTYGAPN